LKRSTDACSLVWREGYDLEPRTIFDVALAGWMNRQQQEASEYLRTENRVLREKLGHKRLILNESQKRRLAEAAGKLGKDLQRQVGTLFSPETIAWDCTSFCTSNIAKHGKYGKRGIVRMGYVTLDGIAISFPQINVGEDL